MPGCAGITRNWSKRSHRRNGTRNRPSASAQQARIDLALLAERNGFGQRFGQATLVKLIHEMFESGKVGVAEKIFENLRTEVGESEPRGFAWGYLRGLFRPEITQLGDGQSWDYEPILQLAISHDGRTLAAGFANGRVMLWDLIQDRLLHMIDHRDPGTSDKIYLLAFSPDGRLLASGSPPTNRVKVWDVETG